MLVLRYSGKAKGLPRELEILQKCKNFSIGELTRLKELTNPKP